MAMTTLRHIYLCEQNKVLQVPNRLHKMPNLLHKMPKLQHKIQLKPQELLHYSIMKVYLSSKRSNAVKGFTAEKFLDVARVVYVVYDLIVPVFKTVSTEL